MLVIYLYQFINIEHSMKVFKSPIFVKQYDYQYCRN